MKRQALIITIQELKELVDELDKEVRENKEKYKVSGWGTKFQIDIINKTPECSDAWEIEGNKNERR